MNDPIWKAPARAPAVERVQLLDTLRALALLGVIIMNISGMIMRFDAGRVLETAGPLDFAVAGFDLIFLQGKARSCFAFLFGVGFAILMSRSEAMGKDFGGFYVRRMLALFAFGLVNQAFLFWGDILATYALLGLVLLLFRDASDRTILRTGLILVIAPPLLAGLVEAVSGQPVPNLVVADAAAEQARGLAAVTSPHYLDLVAFSMTQAIERYATQTSHKLIYDLGVLGLFLLGAWTARRGVLLDVEANRPLLRRIARWCIPTGIALSILNASRLGGVSLDGALHGLVTAAFVGLPILALGYISILALLFSRRARRLQSALAPAGRMALTNYLASGAIGASVFYGFGLGRIGDFNVAPLNLFAIAMFVGMVAGSAAWLSVFRQGPVEWLWRCLSHGERQPMLRRGRQASPA